MRSVPRQQLHSDFVDAVRASGHSLVNLAAHTNFADTQLSSLLARRVVRASMLNIDRLRKLAEIVLYDGPILKRTKR